MDLVSVRYDIRGNRIMVGVNGSVDRAKQALGETGGPVTVEAKEASVVDACINVKDCPPGKGGIRINDGTFCTSAIMGKRTDGNQHRVLITAGHCLRYNATGEWKHSGQVVGTDEDKIWQASLDKPYPEIKTDIGIIDLADGFLPASGDNNQFIFSNSGETKRFGALQNAPTGTPVCTIGAGSETKGSGWNTKRCGQIEALYILNLTCKNEGTEPPCAKINFTIEVDFDSTGGDSGAPYWINSGSSPYTLLGIHTHSTVDDPDNDPRAPGKFGWYVPITRGLYQLSQENPPIIVHACTDGSCSAP